MKRLIFGLYAFLLIGTGCLTQQSEPLALRPVSNDTTVVADEAETFQVTYTNTTFDEIFVTAPTPDDVITSPLIIRGQARGGWFFEASAPMTLEDADGKMIAQGVITSQGDWMTEEFVPFTGSLPFTKPTSATGQLILSADNPSGDAARDRSIHIPILFQE